MQRIIALILIFAYSGVTAATDVNLHYCDGRWMTDMSMMQPELINHDTGCHKKFEEKDCCKHPLLQVKFKANQLPVGIYIYHPYYFATSFSPGNRISPLPAFATGKQWVAVHSPPQWLTTIHGRQAFYGVFMI